MAARLLTRLAVIISGLVTASVAVAVISAARAKHARVECQAHPRELGVAALQYGDVERSLPHAGDAGAPLSGGVESSASIQIKRVLITDEWLLLPLGLVGLVVLLRAGPPPPAPARGVVLVRPSSVVSLAGRSELAAAPGPGVAVHADQRCPWCRAGIAPTQALTVCPACRTTFHADCAAPGAACTTLGCTSARP